MEPRSPATSSAPAPVPPAPDVVAALATDAERPVVVVARRGVVRTSRGGPAVGAAAGPWPWGPAEEVRVSTAGARPARVMTDTGRVRVLLLVDDADLGKALVKPEVLRPTPGAPPPSTAFVELGSGAVIDVVETSADARWIRVGFADPFRWKTADVLHGWVPASSVGSEVTVVDLDATTSSRVADVEPGAVLLDAPGGRPIVTFPRSGNDRFVTAWHAVPLGPPVRGHQRVEHVGFCSHRVRLVGWVASSRVDVRDDLGGGGGCGTGTGGPVLWGALETAPREKVAAGRWLLDPATGDVIGLVREDAELGRSPDGRLHVATKFGPIPVALAPEGWKP